MELTLTKEEVFAALSTVQDPDLKKDLVTLKMIDNLQIEGNSISFTVLLTTPACPMKEYIKNSCIRAVQKVAPHYLINVTMSSKSISTSPRSLKGVKNIILVASAKGGVGKSTIAANLAAGLAFKGSKVGLLDADIYGPSVPTMFGKDNCRVTTLNNEHQQAIIQPLQAYGVKVLSMGFFIRPEQAVPWRGPMISSTIKQFIDQTNWGELDYLVIDMPPGTGDIHLTIVQHLPVTGALIVTTPQKVSSNDVLKGMTMFLMENIGVKIIGIVENMAYYVDNNGYKHYIFGKKHSGKVLADSLNIPYICEIPIFPDVNDSCDEGKPAILSKNVSASYFNHIVERVACTVSVFNS